MFPNRSFQLGVPCGTVRFKVDIVVGVLQDIETNLFKKLDGSYGVAAHSHPTRWGETLGIPFTLR